MSVKLRLTYLKEAYDLASEIPGIPCDCDAPYNVSEDANQPHGKIWKTNQDFNQTCKLQLGIRQTPVMMMMMMMMSGSVHFWG
jgi:hypothetical protein